jgi:pyruvate formate lyase activating enzyme
MNSEGVKNTGESYLNTKGRIFDIQRYSIHDGIGIRTIVFLKGCILRCRWCCNPESQRYEIQSMREANGKVKTVGMDVTVKEVMETVEKDRIYYRRSLGGLTLSGGECLCQPEFSRDLLHAAKDAGFSTAIESMAGVDYSRIEMVLPYLDQYLMDIKHTDRAKHLEYTGRDNDTILANARKVAESGQCEQIIRTPVIPGFNDTEAEISDIAAFAASLPGVSTMHILPYHRLGYDKYIGLGREYSMGDLPTPTIEKMRALKSAVEKTGLTCIIGG